MLQRLFFIKEIKTLITFTKRNVVDKKYKIIQIK